MRERMKATLVGLSLLFASGAQAAVKFGSGGSMDCNYPHPSVTVTAAGLRHYTIAGSCTMTSGADVGAIISYTATDTWDPGASTATEQMQGSGWTISTKWWCGGDPWLTSGHTNNSCSRNTYAAAGDAPDLSWNINGAPFSAYQMPVQQLGELVKKATPPVPALPPLNVQAIVTAGVNRAKLTWQLPADQTSFHQTVAWYLVRRRPAEAGATWFPASTNLSAATTAYTDPDPVATKTEYVVCAGNVSGWRCSAPVPATSSLSKTTTQGEIRPAQAAAAQPTKATTLSTDLSSAALRSTAVPTAPYTGSENKLYKVATSDDESKTSNLKRSGNPTYAGSYTIPTTPVIQAGKTAVILVTVRNDSSVVWPAGGAFQLSYHWYGPGGELSGQAERSLLPSTVNPMGTAQVSAKVTGPPTPGVYTLKWDMFQVGVGWFSSKGVPTKDQLVTIAP